MKQPMLNTFTEKIYTHKGRDFSWIQKDTFTVYNLGSGQQLYKGVVGVDSSSTAEMVHDLNTVPWPMKDASVDLFVSFHVFEHLDDLSRILKEAQRTLKPHGRIIIEVPYFRHPGAYQDPTHVHFFTSKTMEYFCRTGPSYTRSGFKQIGFWYGWPCSRTWVVAWFKRFARRHSVFFDTYLSMLVPFPVIIFELEVLK